MSEPREDRCENCIFWAPVGDGAAGECRRRAPTATKPDYRVFATTEPLDWCGEWQGPADHGKQQGGKP